MSKQKLFILITLQCSLVFFSLHYQSQPQAVYSQTIPSPTPNIPATNTPNSATNTPVPAATSTPGSNGGGGNNTPTSTNTPQPGATATSTVAPAATFAPTPEGGFIPTAAPCEDSPTIQAFNNLNVRQGPGTDYEIISRVIFQEVRPIIGSSEYGQWWLIELADGRSGWVADATGLSQGYIGNLPVVAAPPINNQTPTPGATWQPTPRASCTVTPTPTAAATATETTTPLPTPTATATAVAATNTPTATATPESANNEADAATRIAAAANLSVADQAPTATQAPTAYPLQAATAIPLEEDTPANSPSLLPIVGLILVGGGLFVAIARRQSRKS